MPRPRFDRLEPARRDAIFDAAAAEFGEHGFSRASYNRIIERAGLSKGAMYYYFDDKRDLFVTVVEDAVERLFGLLEAVGEVTGVEAFWARVGALMRSAWAGMLAEPRVAALMPVLLDPRNATDVPEAMVAMNERIMAWIREFLEQGRAVSAVRTDLPDDLLLAVTFAVGEAMDRWVASRLLGGAGGDQGGDPAGEAGGPSSESVDTAVDLLRRLLAPA